MIDFKKRNAGFDGSEPWWPDIPAINPIFFVSMI